MSCVCDREYDSVTGKMNDYVCDWCQAGSEKEEKEKEAQEGCSCQYDCERDDVRWGDYRYQIWQCEMCAEEDRRQQKEEENRCFAEYAGDQEEEDDDRCYCEYGYERGGDRWDDYCGGYRYLEWECDMCVAERKKLEPAPVVTNPKPADPWATEKSTIGNYLSAVSFCSTSAQRVEVVRSLFEYILTVEPFLKTFPRFHTVCVAKVAELKAEPLAASIAELLERTERFLASIA